MTVLLVFNGPQAGIGALVGEELARITDGGLQAQQVSSAPAAISQLHKQNFQAVVVTEALALHFGGRVYEKGGWDLCRQIRQQWKDLPILVLVPQLTNDVQLQCAAIEGRPPVAVDDETRVPGLVQALIGQADIRLEIRVLAGAGGWKYDMAGVGFAYEAHDDLVVQKSARMWWADLRLDSASWYMDFSRIGDSIRTCLCEDNENFEKDRQDGMKEARRQNGLAPDADVDNHIVFGVDREHYRLILEAVLDPQRPEPWMLSAAMRRHVPHKPALEKARESMFRPSSPRLRALVICANTSGTFDDKEIPGGRVRLKPLEMLEEECRQVQALLERPDPHSGREWFDVTTLGLDGQEVNLRRITDMLRKRWDLIHFAGHSCFYTPQSGQDAGSGYVFVGPPGAPEGVKFNYFAPFCRDAGFLYLSSCESGNSSFAMEATSAGVETILGFRWGVDDQAAFVQATVFYEQLMDCLSIDIAFRNTRRHLYEKYRTTHDNVWASSMLVTLNP